MTATRGSATGSLLLSLMAGPRGCGSGGPGDVGSEVSAREFDASEGLVGRFSRMCQIRAEGGDREHTTAAGDDVPALVPAGAGVQDRDARQRGGGLQAVDHATRNGSGGVPLGGED